MKKILCCFLVNCCVMNFITTTKALRSNNSLAPCAINSITTDFSYEEDTDMPHIQPFSAQPLTKEAQPRTFLEYLKHIQETTALKKEKLEREKQLAENYKKLEEEIKLKEKKRLEQERKLKEEKKRKQAEEQAKKKQAQKRTPSRGSSYTDVYEITGYCACKSCCGKSDGITASGKKARPYHTIAADTRILPFGTKVRINGHIYTVEDRGGAIKGKKIDMFFSSHQEALKWGRRKVKVEIIR